MTLRQLPGATVLGLVTALTAHALLFGREHAWGGAYHGALLQFTLAAMTGLIAAAGALLWSGSRCAADGTVLAARIRGMLPGWPALAGTAAGWFFFGERLEPAHAMVPLLVTIAVIAIAAWLVLRLASAALGLLAGFVFAILRAAARERRLPSTSFTLSERSESKGQDDALWCARLLRAPPVIANA